MRLRFGNVAPPTGDRFAAFPEVTTPRPYCVLLLHREASKASIMNLANQRDPGSSLWPTNLGLHPSYKKRSAAEPWNCTGEVESWKARTRRTGIKPKLKSRAKLALTSLARQS